MTTTKVVAINKDYTPSVVVRRETITPTIAAEMLRTNTHNRIINNRRVIGYARDMQNGKWALNNDAVAFDINGVLLNGQHRLHACVTSGTSFETLVMRGLPPEAQDVMDQGGQRTVTGILQLRGVHRAGRIRSIAQALVDIANAGIGYKIIRPSPQELLQVVDRHPGLLTSLKAVDGIARGLPYSFIAAIHYLATNFLGEEDKAKADAFVQVFTTGVPAYPGDPAHAFREVLVRNLAKKQRLVNDVVFYSTLHCWNLFREGATRQKWQAPRDVVTIKGLRPEVI